MAINRENIKLFASQRLTDEDDGGGRATGNVVTDGQVNNLFRDISRIDRTVGDVSMRKVFVGVSTDNTDPYLGAHVILADAPEDERVGVVLFNTENQIDERADARNRIESYVVPAVDTNWQLLDNQLVGQRTLLAIQREEHRLPEIGEVYRLLNEATGDEQYVRIISVEGSMETFTYAVSSDSYVDFERRRLQPGLSAPLKVTFPGGVATPGGTIGQNGDIPSRIQTTQVADAARYYGLQSLKVDASQNDLTFKVNSVYGEMVPSARSETPLINQDGTYPARVVHPVSPRSVSLSFGLISGNQSRAYLQTGAVPKTVTLSIAGCLRWQKEGIKPPASVVKATEEYFDGEDALGQWLEERCDVNRGQREGGSQLYNDWRVWCDEQGHYVSSVKQFSENLQFRGFRKCRMTTGHRGLTGLKLRPQPFVKFGGHSVD